MFDGLFDLIGVVLGGGGVPEGRLGDAMQQLRVELGYSSHHQAKYFEQKIDNLEDRVRKIESLLIIKGIRTE